MITRTTAQNLTLRRKELWRKANKATRRWSRQGLEAWASLRKWLHRRKKRLTRRISSWGYSATQTFLSWRLSSGLVPLSGSGVKRTWINTVFSLLFTPLGRYAIMGFIILSIMTGVYYKIRRDAVAEIEAAATEDILRRTRNAVQGHHGDDHRSASEQRPTRRLVR